MYTWLINMTKKCPMRLNVIIKNLKHLKKNILSGSHIYFRVSLIARLSIKCIRCLCLNLTPKSSLIIWQSPSNLMFELLTHSGTYLLTEFAFMTCKKTSVTKAHTEWKESLTHLYSIENKTRKRSQWDILSETESTGIFEMCFLLVTWGLRRKVEKGPHWREASSFWGSGGAFEEKGDHVCSELHKFPRPEA